MENSNLENMNPIASDTGSQDEKKENKKNFKSDFMEIIESTLITVFVIVLIFTYLLHPVNVIGTSMVPTLNDDDRIFMSTISTDFSYGDIVVVNNDAAYLLDAAGNVYESDSGRLNECIIKRVIACGGQTVDIDFGTGTVTVDGEILDEPYINAPTFENEGAFTYPIVVPEGYYFVMGDNRNRSSDSRNANVGFIKKDQIYGKAIIRYSPEFDIL